MAAPRRLTALALLIALLFCWTMPVLWGAVTSFKNDRDVLNYPPIGPFHPTLANYFNVMSGAGEHRPESPFEHAILSVAATLLTLVLAIPAATRSRASDLRRKSALGSTCWRPRCCRRSA